MIDQFRGSRYFQIQEVISNCQTADRGIDESTVLLIGRRKEIGTIERLMVTPIRPID